MRRLSLVLSFLLFTISVALSVTGGFTTTVWGTRVSARSPGSAVIGAAIAAGLWLIAAWPVRSVAADLEMVAAWIERHARAIVVTLAGLAGAVAIRFATFSASGADPSGYFSEAVMLGQGALARVEALASIADWAEGAATLAPLGWRAASDVLQVPTYAVGLPLVMMVPHALGGALAASLVVCVSAALVVWFGARLAMAVAGGLAGIVAAVWLATMPIQIFESVQPMSDVPVTAAWLACWWWIGCRLPAAGSRLPAPGISSGAASAAPVLSTILAGIAAALAVLIRPNLAPLAAVPVLFLLSDRSVAELKSRATRAAAFAAPVAIAGAVVAYLQWRWFGSPLRSGYGTAEEIYALSNLAPNAALYFRWLVDTHGPWLLTAPLALVVVRARLLRWLLAFAVLVCLAYFFYAQFDTWPYLRFLLPAMAIAAIAVSAAAAALVAKLPAAARPLVLLLVVLGIAASQVASARTLEAFRLAARQSRALVAGRYLASALPPHAVLLTGEQSGAMRYYTGRPIVRWDLVAPSALAVVEQRLADWDLWVVLDDWEAPLLRAKFAGATPAAALDWPPAMDAGPESRIHAWRVKDRERFLRGDRVVTDRLR